MAIEPNQPCVRSCENCLHRWRALAGSPCYPCSQQNLPHNPDHVLINWEPKPDEAKAQPPTDDSQLQLCFS